MVILGYSDDRIKVLEVASGKGPAAVTRVAQRGIAGLSDDAVSAAVTDVMREAGIRNVASLAVVIPRHLVTVRMLRLPSVDEAELQSMVDLQAGKQLPYPLPELVWDFKVIEKRPDGYSDVLLVIVQRSIVDRLVAVAKNAGMEIDRIIVSSEALAAWYDAATDFQASEAATTKAGANSAVIDIDSAYVDVIVVREGRWEFSRSFPFRDEPAEVAEEVKKTFYSYEKENNQKVSRVVVTGIEERGTALPPLLRDRYKDIAVEFTHPLRVVSAGYRETVAHSFDAATGTSLASLLGIVYNAGGVSMNFLPAELKEKAARRVMKKKLIATIALACASAVLMCVVILQQVAGRRAQARDINTEIKETEPKVKRLREISQNLEIIKSHLDMKGSSVDVIREVYALIPADVSLGLLDFELGKSLLLRGTTSDLKNVIKFTQDLERSPYFENCLMKYAQKRVTKTSEFVDFELSCRLSRAGP